MTLMFSTRLTQCTRKFWWISSAVSVKKPLWWEHHEHATDAKCHITECLICAHTTISACAQVDADAATICTELTMYKVQLEQAQCKINHSQEYLDGLQAHHYDTEQDAAHTRSMACRLQEECAIDTAWKQGKQQGYNEGLH